MTLGDEAWTRTEVFIQLLRRVNAVLVKHDPMDIAIGPTRALEYDLEAGQITRLTIETAQHAGDVRSIVDRVFAMYFWAESAVRLDLAAEDIWRAYCDLLARRAVKRPSRRALGQAAVEYARSRLWLAGAFEPALDEQLRSDDWRAWTWADRDVSPERLARYGEGGHVFTGDSIEEQIGRIVRPRMRRPDGIWVVPDPMAKPTDRSLREIPHASVQDTVYYRETSPDDERLSRTWTRAASAAGTIGLVTTATIEAADDDPRRLRAIAIATHFLVLEAYDGDGVIYIERNRPSNGSQSPPRTE